MTVPPPPPKKATELPYGTVLIAGLGESTVLADFDFETYSSAGYEWDWMNNKWKTLKGCRVKGLSAVGLQNYAEHSSTEVLSLWYDLKDGRGPRHWCPEKSNPEDLFAHVNQGKLLEAFNAAFEERIWNEVCVKKYGWPELDVKVLRCSHAKAKASCLPPGLGDLCKVTGTELKDDDGKRLLNIFSKPRNPTKKDPLLRHTLRDRPDEAQSLIEYNKQDIVAEAEASALIPDLIPQELEYWMLDQECNRSGVKADTEAITKAIEYLDAKYEESSQQLEHITGGEVTTPSQIARMVKFLKERGVETASLDEENVTRLLAIEGLPEDCRNLLNIRSQVGSAAVKKFYPMNAQVTERGRLHDMFNYHGARTGRDSGRGVQPQNFPNSGPDVKHCGECDAYFGLLKNSCPVCSTDAAFASTEEWSRESANYAVQALKANCLDIVFDDGVPALSGCLRGMMVADEGYDFVVTDYNAIEAVVAAVVAGETWRIEVFTREDCIYLASASKITGTPVERYLEYKEVHGHHHPHRKLGKIAELASGYGGGKGSWISFGALDHLGSEEEIQRNVWAWREASPAIVNSWGGQHRKYGHVWVEEWYGLEGAFLRAYFQPGVRHYWNHGVYYVRRRDTIYCVLPSGRSIAYHDVRMGTQTMHGRSMYRITFKGWNTNPKMGPQGWTRLDTYGGRLFENVVQAIARDILVNAAINLERQGYKIKLRIHDELVAQVQEGHGSVEEMESIANQMPPFAEGWPIRATGGWIGKRYGK